MGLLGVGALLLGATPSPICVPGTAVCAVSDGRGGVKLDASGNAQASPTGVGATGQAGGNAQGDANAVGNAQGQGQAQTSNTGTTYYRQPRGRFGSGVTLCPIARVGIWSGFKVGGCIAVGLRWEHLTFEMETQLLYGGVTHAFDWSFPMSFVVPLDNDDSLFDGPYLRFGGSPVGATFARRKDGGSFVRFGLYAGGGYEWNIADWLAWRVIDVRLAFDMGTQRAMDDRDHWFDPGVQLGTGLVL